MPEKNGKGKFCFKTNYFANPSFLGVGRNGDPISNSSKPIQVLTRTKFLCIVARFSADLEQLQNWAFSTWNRSKPIRVLTQNYRHIIPFSPHPRLLAARFSADLKQLLRSAAATTVNNFFFWKNNQRVENSFTTVYVSIIRVAISIVGLLQLRKKQWLVWQNGRAL